MGNQTRSPATMIVVSLLLLVDSCTGGGGGCTRTMSAASTRISTTIKRMMIANISPKSKVMIVLGFNWLLFMCTAHETALKTFYSCTLSCRYTVCCSAVFLYSRSRRKLTEEVGVRYLCKWPLMWWLEVGLKSSQKTEFLPSFWYILLAVHSSFLLVSKNEARWACLLQ